MSKKSAVVGFIDVRHALDLKPDEWAIFSPVKRDDNWIPVILAPESERTEAEGT